MKVLSRNQIREADAYTIEHEPIPSIELMERAAKTFTRYLLKHFKIKKSVYIFCGKGNNGGDGLVVARLLLEKECNVIVFVIENNSTTTDDFQINYQRLNEKYPQRIKHLDNEVLEFNILKDDLVIDALWGTGLNRPIEGFVRTIIEKINNCNATIVAIDIPSGTFCDDFNHDDAKIKAHFTISFQTPKLAFFMPENADFVGQWRVVDIGLHKNFIENIDSKCYFLLPEKAKSILKPRKNFEHKGNFGHALLISGSYGKMGAAVLSAHACLRSGVGLVSVHVPETGYQIVQTSIPEAMVFTDKNEKVISKVNRANIFNAIGLGPGIGTHRLTVKAFRHLLRSKPQSMVIDADGINILARNKRMLNLLPEKCILTPHIGEFERLVGKCENHFQRIGKAKEIAYKHNLIIVLKGHFTAIIFPNEQVYFNSTGNPGMATGGSGDVLTGIILALLAQKYQPEEAALAGVFIHGLAGDLAAEENTMTSLIASDIIQFLPLAFKKSLNKEKNEKI